MHFRRGNIFGVVLLRMCNGIVQRMCVCARKRISNYQIEKKTEGIRVSLRIHGSSLYKNINKALKFHVLNLFVFLCRSSHAHYIVDLKQDGAVKLTYKSFF